MIGPIVTGALKLVDLGLAVAERVAAYQDRRRAARRLRDAYANTTAPVRGCPRCHEIAYLPQQPNCFKCGFALKP